MDLQAFLRRYSEVICVVIVLLVVALIFHWISFKISFLNFFYLPVLAAGYLLTKRQAIASSVLCVLLVLIYYFWAWTKDALMAGKGLGAILSVAGENWQTIVSLAMWGGFLILTGTAFAHAYDHMRTAYENVRVLNEELNERTGELQKANEALQASAGELRLQAELLQEKNLLVEKLKQEVEQALYSTMDTTVARLIIQGRLREEKRDISVLFCDLVGFSMAAQARAPEVILEDLNRFYEAMEGVMETYHGHIDKYLGDGIMCEFGAPVVYEQHSLQAVVAGLKMQEKYPPLKLPWRLRVGVASGEAVVGLLGSRRHSYSALGEVVNLAKRLEEICEPGAVYMDERACGAVQPFVELERVRSFGGRRSEDKAIFGEIAEKLNQLEHDPANVAGLFEVGKLYFRALEPSRALGYFRRAMELRPDDTEIKVAYADATVKQDEYEKVSIRGLAEKRAVFKALSMVNPLENRDRFPQKFYERYQSVERLIEIPEDVVLPVEVSDSSVGHSLGVTVLSYALADQLSAPGGLKQDLLIAARLQDIGKAVVWHHVLNRRGGLSDQERKDMESHVVESVAGAKRMGYDRPGVLEIIANHHELLNGTGYPNGSKGDQIPLGARISCVADVYCALTARRPYREAWDSHAAVSELRKGAAAGKYDSNVVEALGTLMS